MAAPPTSALPTASPDPAAIPLENALDRLAAANHSDVLALVQRPGWTWRGATGPADREDRAEPSDQFGLASTTKTYVAVVVMQLAGEGRLRLDDTVEHWLPGRIRDGDRILVRHLLNHTSGLPQVYGGGPTADGQAPISEPGAGHHYSNLNYALLEEIVGQVTGEPAQVAVRDRIFEPLHLASTRFGSAPPVVPKGVTPRRPGPESAVRSSPGWLGSASQVGGISSTAADVATFYRALLGARLLGPEQQREILTVVPTDADSLASPAGGPLMAGYGIFRFELPCGIAWGHGGDMPTYSNQVLASPDGSTVVVVAQDTSGWPSASATAAEMFCQ